jgi:hypothetical protein
MKTDSGLAYTETEAEIGVRAAIRETVLQQGIKNP